MSTVIHRPLTAHDYRETPEYGPRYQLIEGDLYMAPSPNRFHQKIAGDIHYEMEHYLRQHTLGVAYMGPFDVYLTDLNVYQPDVCYFSKERYSYLTDEGANGAPDLVVEVLSPSTSKFDLGAKKEIYARTGVLEYWIVDPVAKMVKVYHLADNADTPHATLTVGRTLTTPLLPGFSLQLAALFNNDPVA